MCLRVVIRSDSFFTFQSRTLDLGVLDRADRLDKGLAYIGRWVGASGLALRSSLPEMSVEDIQLVGKLSQLLDSLGNHLRDFVHQHEWAKRLEEDVGALGRYEEVEVALLECWEHFVDSFSFWMETEVAYPDERVRVATPDDGTEKETGKDKIEAWKEHMVGLFDSWHREAAKGLVELDELDHETEQTDRLNTTLTGLLEALEQEFGRAFMVEWCGETEWAHLDTLQEHFVAFLDPYWEEVEEAEKERAEAWRMAADDLEAEVDGMVRPKRMVFSHVQI